MTVDDSVRVRQRELRMLERAILALPVRAPGGQGVNPELLELAARAFQLRQSLSVSVGAGSAEIPPQGARGS